MANGKCAAFSLAKCARGNYSMKSKRLLFVLVLGIGLLTAVFLTTSTQAVQTADDTGLVHSFDIPYANGNPQKLVVEQVGPPAKLWFTMPDADAIGQLVVTSTVDFQFQQFQLAANSEPYDLVFDAANDFVYFTEHSTNKLGRIDVVTKNIAEFPLLSGGSGPAGIAIAPNGLIWLVQDAANRVTSFNPTNSGFTDYPYTTPNAQPTDVAAINNNEIWFTAPAVNNVVRLTPGNGQFSSSALLLMPGSPTFAPGGVTIDSALPWVSAPSEGLIGRFAPGTLSLWRWYDVSTFAPSPTALTYRANGNQIQIWFVDTASGKAGQLYTDSNGNLEFRSAIYMPGDDPQPTDIQLDLDGTAWIANSGSGTIVKWDPPYYFDIFLPIIMNP